MLALMSPLWNRTRPLGAIDLSGLYSLAVDLASPRPTGLLWLDLPFSRELTMLASRFQ